MAPTIWIPGQEQDERQLICRVPTGPDEVCGMTFTRRDVWQRHVGRCARAHAADIQAASLKARIPIFDEDQWDPEVAAHMRKVGERMKAERRLEVKPNERAGFS